MSINDIIPSITLMVVVIGTIIALKQLRDQHELSRREKSLSYSSICHPELVEIKTDLEKEFSIVSRDDPIPMKDISNKVDQNKKLGIYLDFLLNYYENLSIAYYFGLADEDTLFHLLSHSLISYRKNLINYIEFTREQKKNKEIWINLETLSNKWENRIKESKERKKTRLGFFFPQR